jgi:hypothetical protein
LRHSRFIGFAQLKTKDEEKPETVAAQRLPVFLRFSE